MKMSASQKAAWSDLALLEAQRQRNLTRPKEVLDKIKEACSRPESKAKRRATMAAKTDEERGISNVARWAGDARQRQSALTKGRQFTESHRAAISAALARRGPLSEEVKNKMRAAHLARHAKLRKEREAANVET